jgi:hypothetical protein
VPFLSTYMPHLQTLRLWREDDFPWTSSKFIQNKSTKKDYSHLISVDRNFSLSYLNERDIFPHKFEKCQNDSISRMEAMWHTGKFKLSIREKTSRKYLCC